MAGKSSVTVRFLGDTKSFEQAVARTQTGMKHVGVGSIAAGAALGGLAVAGVTAFAGIAAGALSTGVKTAAAMEQAQVGFTTLIGSAKGAQDYLGKLSAFAAATPFEMNGLIDASRTLLGVGVSAKDVIPMLTDFGDAAGAVGLGQDQFQRIMVATSQAIGAGKFQTADLNQIMNNGLPVWSILSKAMGKPVTVLRDLASKGKLLAKDVMPALQKEMHKDYGGAMAKQSQTLAGIWSTLSDTFTQGMAQVLVPMLPFLKSLATGGIGLLSSAFTFLAKAGKWVSDAMSLLVSGFEEGNVSGTALGAVGDTLFQVWTSLSTFWTGTLHPALKVVGGFITGTLWPALVTVAGFVTGSLIPAVVGLAKGFMENVWPAIKMVVGMVVSNLKPAITELATFWTGTLYPAIVRIIPFIAKVATVLGIVGGVVLVVASWLIGKLVPVIALVIGWVVNIASTFLTMVGKVLGYGLTFVGWFVKLPGKIASAISGLWDGLKNGFKAALNWIIDRWNSFPKFKLPSIDIGPIHYGGGTIGLPTLPHLANGGIVTRPTVALIGEAGPEAVVPLSRGRDGMGGGGTVINLNIGAGVIHGSPLEVARQLHAVMQDAQLNGINFGVPA